MDFCNGMRTLLRMWGVLSQVIMPYCQWQGDMYLLLYVVVMSWGSHQFQVVPPSIQSGIVMSAKSLGLDIYGPFMCYGFLEHNWEPSYSKRLQRVKDLKLISTQSPMRCGKYLSLRNRSSLSPLCSPNRPVSESAHIYSLLKFQKRDLGMYGC